MVMRCAAVIMTRSPVAVIAVDWRVGNTLLMRRNLPMLVGMTQLRRDK